MYQNGDQRKMKTLKPRYNNRKIVLIPLYLEQPSLIKSQTYGRYIVRPDQQTREQTRPEAGTVAEGAFLLLEVRRLVVTFHRFVFQFLSFAQHFDRLCSWQHVDEVVLSRFFTGSHFMGVLLNGNGLIGLLLPFPACHLLTPPRHVLQLFYRIVDHKDCC